MSQVVWLRGAARLLDPAGGLDRPGDLWIRDGVIQAVGEAPPPPLRSAARVIDAQGGLVTPAFWDLHVHLREPGGEASETLASGTNAALAGGFGAVCAMPNTRPPCDRPERVTWVRERTPAGGCEVLVVGALSRNLEGRALADLDAMRAAGAVAFSDDGGWLADDALAQRAFRWAAENDALIMQHCEDLSLAPDGVLHDAAPVRSAGLAGIPREAEDRALARDLDLAREFRARYHACHVATEGSVDLLRRAKAEGLPVSGEVTPHHLLLTYEDALAGGPDFKVKPPLREARDREAVRRALADGTLEAVATDHAPHHPGRKACGWREAAFGMIGLETAFPALYTDLVLPGLLGLTRLVETMTSAPAAVLGREAGRLRPGAPAALNVIDRDRPREVVPDRLRSLSRNCPFAGRRLCGWPAWTLLGTRVWDHRCGPGTSA